MTTNIIIITNVVRLDAAICLCHSHAVSFQPKKLITSQQILFAV